MNREQLIEVYCELYEFSENTEHENKLGLMRIIDKIRLMLEGK